MIKATRGVPEGDQGPMSPNRRLSGFLRGKTGFVEMWGLHVAYASALSFRSHPNVKSWLYVAHEGHIVWKNSSGVCKYFWTNKLIDWIWRQHAFRLV